jgi:hypothetical protein
MKSPKINWPLRPFISAFIFVCFPEQFDNILKPGTVVFPGGRLNISQENPIGCRTFIVFFIKVLFTLFFFIKCNEMVLNES